MTKEISDYELECVIRQVCFENFAKGDYSTIYRGDEHIYADYLRKLADVIDKKTGKHEESSSTITG